MKPLISICGCSYNRIKNVTAWISALIATLECDKFNYEIFIADNGSKDGTAEMLGELCQAYDFIKFFAHGKNLGKAVAVNKLFELTSGEYIVSTDSDIVVPEGWTSGLYNVIQQHPRVGLVSPLYAENGNNPVTRPLKFMMEQPRNYIEPPVALVAGGFFMMPRRTLQLTSGYGINNVYGGIDGWFMHQVGLHKLRIGYTNDVVVTHTKDDFPEYAKWKRDIQIQLRKQGCNIYKVEKGFWDE